MEMINSVSAIGPNETTISRRASVLPVTSFFRGGHGGRYRPIESHSAGVFGNVGYLRQSNGGFAIGAGSGRRGRRRFIASHDCLEDKIGNETASHCFCAQVPALKKEWPRSREPRPINEAFKALTPRQ